MLINNPLQLRAVQIFIQTLYIYIFEINTKKIIKSLNLIFPVNIKHNANAEQRNQI